MSDQNKLENVFNQKCFSCGGDMVFDPKKQKLKCLQCGTLVGIKTTPTSEKSFEELLRNAADWKNETVVYRCENCGAKEVITNSDIAVKCNYCGATNIIKTEDLPGIKPDTIAVFKITKDEATLKAKKWLSKRFFAPNWYKKTVRAKGITGIYYPVFTFDAQTQSFYTGLQVVTRTRTIYRDCRAEIETYKTTHPVSGNVSKIFDDILIPASSTISAGVFEELQPFETNHANVYKKEFLSGFTASHYTKDAEQCWREAKDNMSNKIKNDIYARHGNVESLSVDTVISNVTYKYALLPIYVGHSEYNKKKYNLYVNGQTGKVYGRSPVSFWKAFLATAFGLALVGGAIVLALFFL